MRTRLLDSRWFPLLLAALVADVNFWYFASTGENDADYLGIGLFLIFLVLWLRRLLQKPSARNGVAALGSVLALVLMVLRQTGTFDRGYIPPYLVFAVFSFIAGALPG